MTLPVGEDGNWIQPRPRYDHATDAISYAMHPLSLSLYEDIQKEIDNMYNSADQQLADALLARKQKAELEKKLKLVEEFGIDDFENATVLKFLKSYTKDGQNYLFVALKAAGTWYATGAINGWQRGTWDGLVLSLVSGDFPVSAEDVIIIQPSDGIMLRDLRADQAEESF